ncbi:unnamed protein product [Musa textilis]
MLDLAVSLVYGGAVQEDSPSILVSFFRPPTRFYQSLFGFSNIIGLWWCSSRRLSFNPCFLFFRLPPPALPNAGFSSITCLWWCSSRRLSFNLCFLFSPPTHPCPLYQTLDLAVFLL